MNVGILWDIENVPLPAGANNISSLIKKVSEGGKLSYAMAIGCWDEGSIKNIAAELSVNNFELMHVPKIEKNGKKVKNSSDMYLTAHGVELIFKYPNINRLVLISSDGDFRPLLAFQRKYGKEVWLICDVTKVSADLLKMADKYLDYRRVFKYEEETMPIVKKKQQAFKLFREAIDSINGEGKNAGAKSVKNKMKSLNPQFDEKTLGYEKWTDFIEAAKKSTNISYKDGHFISEKIEN